jgi:hypothetical protein
VPTQRYSNDGRGAGKGSHEQVKLARELRPVKRVRTVKLPQTEDELMAEIVHELRALRLIIEVLVDEVRKSRV